MTRLKRSFFLVFIILTAFSFCHQNLEAAPGDKPLKNKPAKKTTAKKKTAAESESEKTDKKPNIENAEKKGKKIAAEMKPGVKKEFGSREYIFKQAGTEIGSEKLQTRLMSDGTFEGSAEITIRTVTEIKLSQKYSLDARTYELKKYELAADVAGEKQNLKCVTSADRTDFFLTNNSTTETRLF